jgi:protein TonB
MKTEITTAPKWEDIVFEKRNKEYGAYVIRKIYSKNVIIAVTITVVFLGLVIVYPRLVDLLTSRDEAPVENERKLTTVNLDQPPPITPNQPPPPKLDVPPPIKTIRYVAPKVTTEEVPEEEIPTQEELKHVEASTETQEGEEQVVFTEAVQEVVEEKEEDKIFLAVEQPAEFPGGMEAMYKFIGKSIRYPASALRMGIEGKAFIGFVVDKEGNLTDIQIVKSLSADCDKEAIRVVKLMPPWKAGKQNGRAVRSRLVLPITFKITN